MEKKRNAILYGCVSACVSTLFSLPWPGVAAAPPLLPGSQAVLMQYSPLRTSGPTLHFGGKKEKESRYRGRRRRRRRRRRRWRQRRTRHGRENWRPGVQPRQKAKKKAGPPANRTSERAGDQPVRETASFPPTINLITAYERISRPELAHSVSLSSLHETDTKASKLWSASHGTRDGEREKTREETELLSPYPLARRSVCPSARID